MFSCLICVEGQAAAVRFETPYDKKKVTGSVGQSVTFSWKFSGGVDLVTWGLANDDANDIDRRSGRLPTLDGRGDNVLPPGSVPKAYRGRVNMELAQVTFHLVRPASHFIMSPKMMRDFMAVY